MLFGSFITIRIALFPLYILVNRFENISTMHNRRLTFHHLIFPWRDKLVVKIVLIAQSRLKLQNTKSIIMIYISYLYITFHCYQFMNMLWVKRWCHPWRNTDPISQFPVRKSCILVVGWDSSSQHGHTFVYFVFVGHKIIRLFLRVLSQKTLILFLGT